MTLYMSPHVILTTTDELATGAMIPVSQVMKPKVRQKASCPADWLAGSPTGFSQEPSQVAAGSLLCQLVQHTEPRGAH